MITIDMILDELQKYGSNMCDIYPGATMTSILELEKILKRELPGNFKDFLMKCNGFVLDGETLYGIHSDPSLSKYRRAEDLYFNYIIEKNAVGNPIGPHLLPLSPDGFGNHYCLDLNTLAADKKECKVIFWQHDYEFSDDDPPDVDAETFLDFIWQTLMSVKEMFNYDGTDK